MQRLNPSIFFIMCFIVMTAFIVSCGSDSDDSSKEADLLFAWTTDSCCNDGTSNYAMAFLEGFASNESNTTGSCRSQDSDETRQMTRITITWSNETTGLTELTAQRLKFGCVWFFGCGCWHLWSADIPLDIGSNTIKIKALHDDGRSEVWSKVIVY